MKKQHVVLQLVLNEMGIPFEISSLDDRVLIQKGIYLGQRSGADLNYTYGWYLKGPYSPDLTKDYYKIQEALENQTEGNENYQLRDDLREALAAIRPMLEVPEGVALSKADWVEMLASLDYALKVRDMTDDDAIAFVNSEKPRLASYTAQGLRCLKDSHLYK